MPPTYSAVIKRAPLRISAASASPQIDTVPPATTSSGGSDGSRLAAPAASESPHTEAAFSGWKNTGSHPSAISAVTSTFLGPNEAMYTGMLARLGWLISFSGLPSPVPSPSGRGR